MMKRHKLAKAVSAPVIAGLVALSAPQASAQLLGLGVNTDARVGLSIGNSPPPPAHHHTTYSYTYAGYPSGQWYAEPHSHGAHRYNTYYAGYDCHTRFQYTWEHGQRVRYESTFCYDQYDRVEERRGTRVVVRLD
ncbi:hypothetical protein [Ponticaulis sp.]|uniref:hypothetical protein n=1 Tax=Ponticaulis sp. TaxID=2020902 RepID=UPI0025E06151|nr:hypothetical protein [Ponticaulis sp.]